MHLVVALVLPKVVAFDLAVPAQVFGHPDERDRYAFATCTPEPGLVPSTTGFAIEVTAGLEALERADTVVCPGYLPLDPPPPAACDALRRAAARGVRMMSVCTGAFALAGAGLLDGRRAATHWRDAAHLAARYPAVAVDDEVLYVEDGDVWTSAGLAAGIDLCLSVVRHDHGVDVAAAVARRMVVAPYRAGGQAQFLERPLPRDLNGLGATCEWMRSRLHEPITVDDMARHASCSPRTFARRFVAELGQTPLAWLTEQRLFEARRLLERTDRSIDQVADRSGLGSAANLRQHFARELAMTPTSYRRMFQGQPGIRSRPFG